MNPIPPFCKDCIYCVPCKMFQSQGDPARLDNSTCSHESGWDWNLVRGVKVPMNCATNRALPSVQKCGFEGRFFSPKYKKLENKQKQIEDQTIDISTEKVDSDRQLMQ